MNELKSLFLKLKSVLFPVSIAATLFASCQNKFRKEELLQTIPVTHGLIASYSFFGNAADSIGKNHGVVWGATLSPDRFGNINSAYCFDGKNDYINLGSRPSLKLEKMSISLWLKINSTQYSHHNYANQPVISTKFSGSTTNFEAYFIGFHNSFQKVDAANSGIDNQQIASVSNYQSTINDWYHVVYMFDSDSSWLYMNDVLQEKKFKKFKTIYLPEDSVLLGRITNNHNDPLESIYAWLNGCIDDIRIYNRVLTEPEIQLLYKETNPNSTFPGTPDSITTLNDWIFRYWYFPVLIVLAVGLTLVITKWRITQIRNRKEEKQKLQLQLTQMELQALRSQMNPHFIFNALNSIQHFVLRNERELANKYLVKFSQLVRNVLEHSKGELIPLNEELQTVQIFLEIENLRFEDAFTFVMQVDPGVDTQKILVPPLTIQPFVENAIWHGLLPKQGEKKLNLSVFVEQKNTVIVIEDNGIGREAASKAKPGEYKKKSLGMELTKKRLEAIQLSTSLTIELQITDLFDENNYVSGTQVKLTLIKHTS